MVHQGRRLNVSGTYLILSGIPKASVYVCVNRHHLLVTWNHQETWRLITSMLPTARLRSQTAQMCLQWRQSTSTETARICTLICEGMSIQVVLALKCLVTGFVEYGGSGDQILGTAISYSARNVGYAFLFRLSCEGAWNDLIPCATTSLFN